MRRMFALGALAAAVVGPSASSAEQILRKGGVEYLGWHTEANEFRTCSWTKIEIDGAPVVDTEDRCFGTPPPGPGGKVPRVRPAPGTPVPTPTPRVAPGDPVPTPTPTPRVAPTPPVPTPTPRPTPVPDVRKPTR